MATTVDSEQVKAAVRETYGRIATEERSAGCCGSTGCCGPGAQPTSDALGYSDEERRGAPEGADLGLGCGNPQAIAELKSGERVLDLGSGAGFDAFLAARQVGETGRVIGVDMTAEMIAKARGNIAKTDLRNVEFRLGEIEHLPVADAERRRDHVELRDQPVDGQTRGLPGSVPCAHPGRAPGDLRHRRAQGDSGCRAERSRGVRGLRVGRRAHRRSRGNASRRRVRACSRRSEEQQRRPGARLVARRRDARGVRTHPRDKASCGRGPGVARSARRVAVHGTRCPALKSWCNDIRRFVGRPCSEAGRRR